MPLLSYDLFKHLNVLSFCRIRLLPIIWRVLGWTRRLTRKRFVLIIKSWVVLMNPWEPEAIRIRVSNRDCVVRKFKCWEVVLSMVKLITCILSWVFLHNNHMFKNVCRRNDFESKSNLFKFFLNSVKLMLCRVGESKLWASRKHVKEKEEYNSRNSPYQSIGNILSVFK